MMMVAFVFGRVVPCRYVVLLREVPSLLVLCRYEAPCVGLIERLQFEGSS